ncbi:symmetrical bis(5'-nucleosyl)-tetraphosphatase [Blochmannia endosymbiont of Colobopsis nipponica]|uniref:symmetrical bis(5'-nucleosyl)-tetraphosphatase n=1 Tax=Blochmannia endosymbiont of Colobopsis nipponica TaxID=2681987 RepID=UPI0017830790|nr:symmetrical bis(5'-nucleosyl)-tetraphosphatase [Blochmannia endosymbiont of Colobopsis nipponica]QOI11282.1 symmetrical bis(5'-nucleosyl)-tetraphosphatase [Blochmannia endosymbiont of Colobopsis nipponica]
MSTYLIGDIHGCYESLKLILNRINFNIKKDSLWLTGDIVAKGPKSLETLHLIRNLGKNVHMVLGNHDLHLLAIYTGASKSKYEDHLDQILNAPDVEELIEWLRKQPILQINKNKKILMIHAGIHPNWNIKQTIKYAREIENILQSKNYKFLLKAMHGNITKKWNINQNDLSRIIYNIKVFTRIRYCSLNGDLNMLYKGAPQNTPSSYLKPWFDFHTSTITKYNIIFGHWSALMGQGTPKGIYGLDYGCYYTGILTAIKWENKEIIQVSQIKK